MHWTLKFSLGIWTSKTSNESHFKMIFLLILLLRMESTFLWSDNKCNKLVCRFIIILKERSRERKQTMQYVILYHLQFNLKVCSRGKKIILCKIHKMILFFAWIMHMWSNYDYLKKGNIANLNDEIEVGFFMPPENNSSKFKFNLSQTLA